MLHVPYISSIIIGTGRGYGIGKLLIYYTDRTHKNIAYLDIHIGLLTFVAFIHVHLFSLWYISIVKLNCSHF